MIEDEYFMADDIVHALADSGADIVGPVSSVDAALTIVTSGEHLHGAVLDVDLRGGLTFPVADELVAC